MVLGPTSKRRWAYACAKAVDEFLALAYFDEKKLPVVIVRFFNTVGPRQTGQYGMVIPNFVQRALLNEPLSVHGDGDQSRSFTYVGDSVQAIVKLMETKEAEGQVFNVGNSDEITITELAQKVCQLTKSSSEITYTSYEKVYGRGFEDMRRRTPDATKLHEMTGFSPTTSIDAILEKVIDFFKHQ